MVSFLNIVAGMLRLMDVESFQHIRTARNLRGSRLPRGRALPPAEIRALFGACEADDSSIGTRDAAMLAVIFGCGLRRSEAVGLDLRDVVTQGRALRVLGKGNRERLAAHGSGSVCGSRRYGERKADRSSPASAALTP